MADATYQPLVYRQQGGDILVVASGGEINVEPGGTITADGTQASNIADVSVSTVVWTTGDKAKVNDILAVLEGLGATATS